MLARRGACGPAGGFRGRRFRVLWQCLSLSPKAFLRNRRRAVLGAVGLRSVGDSHIQQGGANTQKEPAQSSNELHFPFVAGDEAARDSEGNGPEEEPCGGEPKGAAAQARLCFVILRWAVRGWASSATRATHRRFVRRVHILFLTAVVNAARAEARRLRSALTGGTKKSHQSGAPIVCHSWGRASRDPCRRDHSGVAQLSLRALFRGVRRLAENLGKTCQQRGFSSL